MTRRPTPGEGGFTLVEVMVALLVFGLLAAAGVAVLSFSVRAGALSAARLDQAAALQRTVAVLSADLAQAADRPWRDEGGTTRPAFAGDPSGLTLVRGGWSNLDAAPRSSLQRVSYALNGTNLQRTAFPYVDGAAPLPSAVLMTDLKALRFRFRHNGAWSDTWQGGVDRPLPDAAELVLVRRDGGTYRALLAVGTGYRPAGVSTRVS